MELKIFGYTVAISKTKELFIKPIYAGARRSGRSTRLIDSYVQTLFNTGEVKVVDHHPLKESDRHLFYRVLERLKNEHGLDKTHLKVCRSSFTIQYVKTL